MQNNLSLDLNHRIDPILHNTQTIETPSFQRVTDIAAPFLALYAPTRTLLTISLGASHAWKNITDIKKNYVDRNWEHLGYEFLSLTFTVSSVAVNLLIPIVTTTFSTVGQIAFDAREMYLHLQRGEWKEGSQKLLTIANHTIYLGSVVFASTELMLLSLVAQGVKELYQANKEFHNEGRKPECLAKVLMAIIRVAQASTHARTVHRNYFGKQMNQDDLKIIIEEIRQQKAENPDTVVEFEEILIKQHYSSKIKDVSFSSVLAPEVDVNGEITKPAITSVFFQNQSFTNCDFSAGEYDNFTFSDVSLKNCNFEYSSFINSLFLNAHISKSNFNLSNFSKSAFFSSSWTECSFMSSSFYQSGIAFTQFNQCNLTEANMACAGIMSSQFNDCDLTYTALNDSGLISTNFTRCKLPGTNFLDATVIGSKLKDCDLTDTLFAGTKEQFEIEGGTPNVITKPVIGILWDFRGIGTMTFCVYAAIKDNNALPLRFDSSVRGISPIDLDTEVVKALDEIADRGIPSTAFSIPDTILKMATPESTIGRIKQRAETISEHIQGLILPGGADVHPEFYGHVKENETVTDMDYRRSMTEFSLLSNAYQARMPVHGTCRGAQAGNVFFGGTLTQHVDDHLGATHNLQIKENADPRAASVIEEIIGKTTQGYSAHSQAADKIAANLHVVMEHDGVPEAIVDRDGKVVFTQFHPEMYFYSKQARENDRNHYPFMDHRNFFIKLIEKANQYRSEKVVREVVKKSRSKSNGF